MTTLLVDGNNILVRAVKATERVPLSADGVPTAALLVFVNTLSRHVREEKPDRLVVCWDGGRSAYRTGLYPAYKANRAERSEEEDARRPFGLVKEFLTLSGIHHIERIGWEADDLIACYWAALGGSIVILSSDKDLMQLIEPGCVQVRVSSQPPSDRWDYDRVVQEVGCDPEDLPKVMAYTGDIGDNVPGVPGIGPKKAVKRLQEADWDFEKSLEGLTEEQAAAARLSLSLVDLRNLPYEREGLLVNHPPPFRPTEPGMLTFGELAAFLDRYALESVRSRILSGELWGSPSNLVHSTD